MYKRKTLVIDDDDNQDLSSSPIKNSQGQNIDTNKIKLIKDQIKINQKSSNKNSNNKSDTKNKVVSKNRSIPFNKDFINKKQHRKKSSESSDSISKNDSDSEHDSSYSSKEKNSDDDSESSSESSSSKKSDIKTNKKKTNNNKKVEKEKINKIKSIDKSDKSKLVIQFLSRWWYALDEWPPKNYDYSQILKHKKLRKIDKSEWKFESDLDENGFKKVTEMSGFNGVFVDSSGKTYDLRPQENKPSYNNFIKKEEKTIYELLIKAIQNQINMLENEKYSNEDKKILLSLKEELNKAEKCYNRLL